jgi:SAM-dependent methyltransferase
VENLTDKKYILVYFVVTYFAVCRNSLINGARFSHSTRFSKILNLLIHPQTPIQEGIRCKSLTKIAWQIIHSSMYNYQTYQEYWTNPESDYSKLLLPFLENTLKTYYNSNILDIGFGSGIIPQILKKQGFQGTYLGVDIDKQALEYGENLNLGSQYKFQTEYKNQKADITSMSLSSCEMDEKTLQNYAQHLNTKTLIIINPSSITQFYPSKIIKPFFSKIFSRFGVRPNWQMVSKINQEKFYQHNIGFESKLQAKIYQRTLGDYLNIFTNNGYTFSQYYNLTYTENTIKTAPVSKFEVLIFSK